MNQFDNNNYLVQSNHLSSNNIINNNTNVSGDVNVNVSGDINVNAINHIPLRMDPQIVDELLTEEMGKLSFQDRNAINEEIHGVISLAPEETPDMIERSLTEMSNTIDRIKHKYTAYVQATTITTSSSESETETGGGTRRYNPYMQDMDIRLRFLRCELFDVSKAAVRMMKYLDLTYELFGTVALKRPIQLCDLGKSEMEMLRIGEAQPIPFRDRSGRRIMVALRNFGLSYPLEVRIRVTMYLQWTFGEDEESQRKGMIGIICWPSTTEVSTPDKFAIVYSPRDVPRHIHLSKRMFDSSPIRIISMHLCLPDKPIYHMMRSGIALSLGEFRSRIKFHSGDSVEIQYHLQGYGIPIDQIPITDTGNIKTKNLHQWIRVRQYLETSRNQNSYQGGLSSSSDSEGSHSSMSLNIDCPNMNDVVFRTKYAYLCHPGNVMFRGLIESRFDEHNNATTTDEKVAVTWSIINAVDSINGRFLVWDDKGCWNELKDRTHIRTKVAGALKDHKRRIKARRNHQVSHSSTSAFQQQDNKNKKRKVSTHQLQIEGGSGGGGGGGIGGGGGNNVKGGCFDLSSFMPELLPGRQHQLRFSTEF